MYIENIAQTYDKVNSDDSRLTPRLVILERYGELLVGVGCDACGGPILACEPLLGEVRIDATSGSALAVHSRSRCLKFIQSAPEAVRFGIRLDVESFLRADQRCAIQRAAEAAGVAL